MSRLSDKAVFKCDKNRGKEGSGRPTFKTAHCEIGERNSCDAQDGGHHSHCNIGYVFIDPAFAVLQLSIPTIIDSISGRTWRSP